MKEKTPELFGGRGKTRQETSEEKKLKSGASHDAQHQGLVGHSLGRLEGRFTLASDQRLEALLGVPAYPQTSGRLFGESESRDCLSVPS